MIKRVSCLILLTLTLSLPSAPEGAVLGQEIEPPALRIFLPTEKKITDSLLRLGDIAMVRGDETLMETANDITLGQMFVPNQKVVLNRATILSRLASHGITGSQVTISGAQQVNIERDQKTISGQDLTELAQGYLQQRLGDPTTLKVQVVRIPQFIYVDPTLKDVQLTPRLNPSTSPGYARVTVSATAAGQPLASRDITFRIQHKNARQVAREALSSGTVLTPENTAIETVFGSTPQAADWAPDYGKVLKRPLAAGMEITAALLTDPLPAVAVEAQKFVIIQLKRPGFQVTVNGVTEAAGRTGDVIPVRNADSRRVIQCTIMPDGTVEPLL